MSKITAHCLVKNEEYFVRYAILSVIDFVQSVIVFDTGSTDETVNILKELTNVYPDKIIFEEKGECDKTRHTKLRQEMVERTNTEWFMTIDGDEVWSKCGMEEVVAIIDMDEYECLIAPYYLCVGDIYHFSLGGRYYILNHFGHSYPRIFKKNPGVYWKGDYAEGDFVYSENNKIYYQDKKAYFLKNKFWHMSALIRSRHDNEITLGRNKQVLTYSLKLIGRGLIINEALPEVFLTNPSQATRRLSIIKSLLNLITLFLFKIGLCSKRYY